MENKRALQIGDKVSYVAGMANMRATVTKISEKYAYITMPIFGEKEFHREVFEGGEVKVVNPRKEPFGRKTTYTLVR